MAEHVQSPALCWCGRSDHSRMGVLLHALTDLPGPATNEELAALGSPDRAGEPDPACWSAHPGVTCIRTAPGGLCAPARCYCGSCPWWSPVTPYPLTEYTVLDARAISKGQRRSSLRSYRSAQAAVAKGKTP